MIASIFKESDGIRHPDGNPATCSGCGIPQSTYEATVTLDGVECLRCAFADEEAGAVLVWEGRFPKLYLKARTGKVKIQVNCLNCQKAEPDIWHLAALGS